MARVGGMLSPVIGKYLISTGMVDEKLPMILFGAFGIVGGLCALILPDTVGFPLPNTFDDVEEMKKNSKPMWKLYKPSKKWSVYFVYNLLKMYALKRWDLQFKWEILVDFQNFFKCNSRRGLLKTFLFMASQTCSGGLRSSSPCHSSSAGLWSPSSSMVWPCLLTRSRWQTMYFCLTPLSVYLKFLHTLPCPCL